MIVDFILGVVQAAVEFVLTLIPDWTIPTGWFGIVGSAVAYLLGLGSTLSVWMPWDVIVPCLVLAWVVRGGMATVSLMLKAFAMIRGGAT